MTTQTSAILIVMLWSTYYYYLQTGILPKAGALKYLLLDVIVQGMVASEMFMQGGNQIVYSQMSYAYNQKSKLRSKQVVIFPVIQFKNANSYFYNILTWF